MMKGKIYLKLEKNINKLIKKYSEELVVKFIAEKYIFAKNKQDEVKK